MDEMNMTPDETLPMSIEPETTEAAEEAGIEIVKDSKGTKAFAHIALWLGILGVLVSAGQFLLLMASFADIQRWHLSFVYTSFGLGGLAMAFAAVCLIRQRKGRKSGKAITGLILGVLPYATYLILLTMS